MQRSFISFPDCRSSFWERCVAISWCGRNLCGVAKLKREKTDFAGQCIATPCCIEPKIVDKHILGHETASEVCDSDSLTCYITSHFQELFIRPPRLDA